MFYKKNMSVSGDMPPLYDASDRKQLLRRALWDIVNGLFFWELWGRLSVNEMRRRYKRTLLGPAWMTVNMLIFASIMSLIWSQLFHQSVKAFLPFMLSGLVPWTLISGIIGEATAAFLGGEGLIKNQQFQYTIMIYAMVSRNIIVFFHNVIGFLLIAFLCGIPLNLWLLLLVPGLTLVVINSLWISLLIAIFCLRYRDFQQIIMAVIQIGVFITPIFWNASQITGVRALIVKLNPLFHFVELLRRPLLGECPNIESILFGVIIAVVGWAITVPLFAAKRHRLAYWF